MLINNIHVFNFETDASVNANNDNNKTINKHITVAHRSSEVKWQTKNRKIDSSNP